MGWGSRPGERKRVEADDATETDNDERLWAGERARSGGRAAGREEADAAPRVWVETERDNSPFPTGRGEGRKAEAVIRDNNEGRGEGIV